MRFVVVAPWVVLVGGALTISVLLVALLKRSEDPPVPKVPVDSAPA